MVSTAALYRCISNSLTPRFRWLFLSSGCPHFQAKLAWLAWPGQVDSCRIIN